MMEEPEGRGRAMAGPRPQVAWTQERQVPRLSTAACDLRSPSGPPTSEGDRTGRRHPSPLGGGAEIRVGDAITRCRTRCRGGKPI